MMIKYIKRKFVKVYWVLTQQFGFDPVKFMKSLYSTPRFLFNLIVFSAKNDVKLELKPCLNDWYEEGGTTKDEYFLQDLIVSRLIFKSNPVKHIDIGSRVDGFVAHVASFREIEVWDIRPINNEIPGIVFKQFDLMNIPSDIISNAGCDSLSCLHTLEHFGLGRYGDPIDVNGYKKGFKNLSKIVNKGGDFYLSVPIGKERVEFNANRVFDPKTIISLANENNLILKKYININQSGVVNYQDVFSSDSNLEFDEYYSLGIFLFNKI